MHHYGCVVVQTKTTAVRKLTKINLGCQPPSFYITLRGKKCHFLVVFNVLEKAICSAASYDYLLPAVCFHLVCVSS